MRKMLITLAATTGFLTLGTIGASAAPLGPLNDLAQARTASQTPAIEKADWYCGPRCEYWRHRRWESQHHWYRPYYPYYNRYGYNYGYGGGYYGYYR